MFFWSNIDKVGLKRLEKGHKDNKNILFCSNVTVPSWRMLGRSNSSWLQYNYYERWVKDIQDGKNTIYWQGPSLAPSSTIHLSSLCNLNDIQPSHTNCSRKVNTGIIVPPKWKWSGAGAEQTPQLSFSLVWALLLVFTSVITALSSSSS